MDPTPTRGTRWVLGLAFGIAALVGLSQLYAYQHWRETQSQTQAIENDALVSIELIGRMTTDVLEERILIDRHIFEHDGSAMSSLEGQIAATKADYAAAATAYAPFAKFPGEWETWRQLTHEVAAIEPGLADALALSRANRDDEASRRLSALEPGYDAIMREATAAIAINRAAARAATGTVRRAERDELLVRMAIAAAMMVITVVAGIWVARTIAASERQLAHQNAELEERNRELDAFAGRVAHDLRGPLSTISMSAALLAEAVPQAPASAILERAIAKTTRLVDDLLELSRAGAIRATAVARIECVGGLVKPELAALVASAGGELRVDLQPAAVTCAEGLLHQVLWNLGENAVKYRRPDLAPAIELFGRAGRDRYELRVSDNGSGMSPDEVSHAFEPFFRGHTSAPGTGLGLSIVRRIIEASGGTISIASRIGRGTTFVLSLPLARG